MAKNYLITKSTNSTTSRI